MNQTTNNMAGAFTLKPVAFFLKTAVSLGLLYLGVDITLWVVNIIDNIINHTDQVAIFNNFVKPELTPQTIEIIFNSDRLEIKNNGEIIWFFFLLIFVILFNVIGRVLAAIFTAMVTLLTNLDVASIKSESKPDEPTENA